MFATHSAENFEVYCYASHRVSDAVTERLRKYVPHWRNVAGMTDSELAERIRKDGIDILIDLSGHTALNRLPVFAWKPAPVQVTWLGYFATTGVRAIDYLIADPLTLPPTEEAYFTENIWRLPETRLCFSDPGIDITPGVLPAQQCGTVTFCCFNDLGKINDGVIALWARVLASVAGSRLLVKAKQLQSAAMRDSLARRFRAAGVPENRLIIEGPSTRADYLAAYRRVDMALDPFPYPGGTTTVEALWMGVPVLTLNGTSFLSRQGVGLLTNAGLEDWIAANQDDYVMRAAAHAQDLGRLASLRSGLRQRVLRSPIFDAPRFAANLETALRDMWRRHCGQGASAGPS
jgi:predicted O-linked N-acetylglucosamine transferase (SPINDLY family)